MPITEFLDGFKFDPETRRVMGIAFEIARATLNFENQTYAAHEIIGKRIIELAKNGVVDTDQLCEQALSDLGTRLYRPPQSAASSFIGGRSAQGSAGASERRRGLPVTFRQPPEGKVRASGDASTLDRGGFPHTRHPLADPASVPPDPHARAFVMLRARFSCMWMLGYGFPEDRTPTHGYEPTREAAMLSFDKRAGGGNEAFEAAQVSRMLAEEGTS